MSTKITHDSNAPTVSVELVITKPLEDYDLFEVEAETPRDVDPMLASQGFKDLIDDARTILERELADRGLEILQLTGAICHDAKVHRPGIWLVVREKSATGKEMSAEHQARVAAAAEAVCSGLGPS
ncbi:MAG TPA: hypothetical protein VKB26_08580 [Candidatus Acidoferrales bacterium]|nr:hypothetical protein [Candidatus Acidoferrales bacterium]